MPLASMQCHILSEDSAQARFSRRDIIHHEDVVQVTVSLDAVCNFPVTEEPSKQPSTAASTSSCSLAYYIGSPHYYRKDLIATKKGFRLTQKGP